MIVGFGILLMGMLLTYIGWRHWHFRKQATVNVIEAAILKLDDDEPLPKTKLDSFLTYAQAALGFTLGPFFALCGVAVLLAEMELI